MTQLVPQQSPPRSRTLNTWTWVCWGRGTRTPVGYGARGPKSQFSLMWCRLSGAECGVTRGARGLPGPSLRLQTLNDTPLWATMGLQAPAFPTNCVKARRGPLRSAWRLVRGNSGAAHGVTHAYQGPYSLKMLSAGEAGARLPQRTIACGKRHFGRRRKTKCRRLGRPHTQRGKESTPNKNGHSAEHNARTQT